MVHYHTLLAHQTLANELGERPKTGTSFQLRTEEDARLYLEAAFEDDRGDGRLIRVAIGDIVRARDMSELAQEIGMTREGLSEALMENGDPSFGTVLKVIRVLGIRLSVAGQGPAPGKE